VLHPRRREQGVPTPRRSRIPRIRPQPPLRPGVRRHIDGQAAVADPRVPRDGESPSPFPRTRAATGRTGGLRRFRVRVQSRLRPGDHGGRPERTRPRRVSREGRPRAAATVLPEAVPGRGRSLDARHQRGLPVHARGRRTIDPGNARHAEVRRPRGLALLRGSPAAAAVARSVPHAQAAHRAPTARHRGAGPPAAAEKAGPHPSMARHTASSALIVRPRDQA
jgi:hypothetical protein